MPLTIGTRLGPYEILSAIGAGGMGEVYKAKDTRLDRVVAIKVLPSHLSENSQLRQRFEREARTISSLSHPNICTLHDIGHQNGTDYLVMEYLEGESLLQRLGKGPLPTDQLLRYGVQVAEALDKAHRQGIIHRDLKPGNIMLTKSGAKLLDFGLAKLQELQDEFSSDSDVPTKMGVLTQEGAVPGTIQYMAPEQLEGKPADARTDIFSLGEILYEMATGKKAFGGNSKASVITSILSTEPPPISSVQPLAPPALEHVVRKCIAKDPEDRWQNARDLAGELKWISESGSHPTTTTGTVTVPRKSKERFAWIVSGLLLLTTLASLFFLYHNLQSPKKDRLLKFSIMPPEKVILAEVGSLAISPDGTKLVFAGVNTAGSTSLYIRALDSMNAERLAGTDRAHFPFWSPDGRYIGFFAEGKLKKMDIAGGPSQILCDVTEGRGATWNQQGLILYSPALGSGLFSVSATGGTPTPVTQLNPSLKEATHRWPNFLPDGKHYLYMIHSSDSEHSGVFAGSLDSTKNKKLVSDESFTVYAPQGYLIFGRNSNLMIQPFDISTLQLKDEAIPVAENFDFEGTAGSASLSVSNHGILAYSDQRSTTTTITWFDRSGKEIKRIGDPQIVGDFCMSPDGKKVVLYRGDLGSKSNLWILELERETFSRFTFTPANEFCPLWSPDGKWIAFASNSAGPYNLYKKLASGGGVEEPMLVTKDWKFSNDWSKDGKYLLFENNSDKTKSDIWALPQFGDKKPFPVVQTEFNDAHAQFSPDGKWIAYGSEESGRAEIYVQSFPTPEGGRRQISTTGGDQPQWRADQKELFYIAQDGKLMSVEIKNGQTLEAGWPTPMFELHVPAIPLVGNDRNQFAVTADGQRFLVSNLVRSDKPTPITVVVNWPELLKKPGSPK